jgi:hypothetical protein
MLCGEFADSGRPADSGRNLAGDHSSVEGARRIMVLRAVLKFHIREDISAVASEPALSIDLECLPDRKGSQWRRPPGWLSWE